MCNCNNDYYIHDADCDDCKQPRKYCDIICPECHRVMMRAISQPKKGERDWINHFELVEWKGFGESAICPYDGTRWLNTDGLYTKDGWTYQFNFEEK